jgi:plastocyanin
MGASFSRGEEYMRETRHGSRRLLALGLVVAAVAAFSAVVLNRGDLSPAAATHGNTSIGVGSNWFCDPSFQNGVHTATIHAGDTITWGGTSGLYSGCVGGWTNLHTVTECPNATYTGCGSGTSPGPINDSGFVGSSGSYAVTFTSPGTYHYLCVLHDANMRGVVEVQPSPTPSPPPPPTPTPTPTTGKNGDVDCNGVINSIDALKVLRHSAGLNSPPCIALGDVDCNGLINSIDALKILRHSAGLPPAPKPSGCPDIGQ